MKTKRLLSMCLIWSIIVLGSSAIMNAQENSGDFYIISGTVKDMRTKKPVEYVNISAVGTNVGTVSNEDGEFTLKLNKELNVKDILLSCIGFYNAKISITKNNQE